MTKAGTKYINTYLVFNIPSLYVIHFYTVRSLNSRLYMYNIEFTVLSTQRDFEMSITSN